MSRDMGNIRNIFDSHCHYADHAFDEDREQLLAELPGKGVELAALISCTLRDTAINSAMSQQYDWLYTTVGIHPEYASQVGDDYLDILRKTALDNPKVRAVGEIGLDYHYPGYDKERQIQVFREQIGLAKELGLPVVIHSRDAAKDTLDMVISEQARDAGGVVHCFSYEKEMAGRYLDLGFYIGIGGVVTFKNSRKLKEVAAYMPMDRMLLETDCPYLAPSPFRGQRNDSTMLTYVVDALSQIRGIPKEEMIRITAENAARMYRIDKME